MYDEGIMMFEISDRPPQTMSLSWLRYILKTLAWLMAFCTVGAVMIYVGQQLFSDYYTPSLGNMLTTACVMLAIGGIFSLFFMGAMKITEIWAELINGGQRKTKLLEALIFDPAPQSDPVIDLKGE
jgi:protein-S-isoprenylcysteine O-methyltransferase Ste14